MDIVEALAGGDRRSIGRANEVAKYVLEHKADLPVLVGALSHHDAVVRMRAADALEKLSIRQAGWLDPFAAGILSIAAASKEQEIRWHMAQILPRLKLDPHQRRETVALLFRFLEDRSRIVEAFALTGLVDLAESDAALRSRVVPLVRQAAATGAPSVKARASKLLNRLAPEAGG